MNEPICSCGNEIVRKHDGTLVLIPARGQASCEPVYMTAYECTECSQIFLMRTEAPERRERNQRDGSRLFVGNLDWSIIEEDLRATFGEFGDIVDCKIIKDMETNRSRGFGFVTFDCTDAAVAARRALNGTNLEGRPIRVDMAHDRPPRGNRK